jgi:hypothetical protein
MKLRVTPLSGLYSRIFNSPLISLIALAVDFVRPGKWGLYVRWRTDVCVHLTLRIVPESENDRSMIDLRNAVSQIGHRASTFGSPANRLAGLE